jgi:hypothetical protein
MDPGGYTQIINYYLSQWGLDSLSSTVTSLGKDPSNSSDSIYLKLQQTPEWKTRFAGNDARAKAGLGVLTPAQYIAVEGQYKQTLKQYGLPPGFYDDKATTDAWIGGDVSPTEVASRAKSAADLVYNSPPEAQQAWDQYYGHGTGGAIASILDTSTAEPLVQKEVAAAQIGGAAMQQGLGINSSRAEQFAAQGVTLDTARKAYSDIASRLQGDTAMSNRFSTNGQQAAGQVPGAAPSVTPAFGQTQEENATLLGNSDAMKQQSTLYAEEKGQFAGHGGAADGSNDPGANY